MVSGLATVPVVKTTVVAPRQATIGNKAFFMMGARYSGEFVFVWMLSPVGVGVASAFAEASQNENRDDKFVGRALVRENRL
jgi:hypothetical protein